MHDLERLSTRECEVLELIAAGKTNKEIAAELGLARSTSKGYAASILAKLGVPSRTAAAGIWFQHVATRTGPHGQVQKAE